MKLKLEQLTKSYTLHKVFTNISLKSVEARLITMIGPSGGGKSTLIRILAGLDSNLLGGIIINEIPLILSNKAEMRKYRKENAIVFQQHNLLPHLNVMDNVIFPLRHIFKVPKIKAVNMALELLDNFKLASYAKRMPHQLSGGQAQRIAITRALVVKPKILFLDEPTSSLDPEMAYEVLKMIENIQKTGTDIILVTHNIHFALRCQSPFLFIDRNSIEYYECEDVANPAPNSRIHQFLQYAII